MDLRDGPEKALQKDLSWDAPAADVAGVLSPRILVSCSAAAHVIGNGHIVEVVLLVLVLSTIMCILLSGASGSKLQGLLGLIFCTPSST